MRLREFFSGVRFAGCIALTAFAFALTGCCNDDDDSVSSSASSVESDDLVGAEVTASIASSSSTRAYDTSWEEGDEIGISCTSDDVEYDNIEYVTEAGDGVFEAVNSAEVIYFQDDNEISLTSYYPYDSNVSISTTGKKYLVENNTADQSDPSVLDYMWAETTASRSDPTADFVFDHSMSKVRFYVSAGNGVDFDDLKECDYTFGDFFMTGTFNVNTGEAVATGDDGSMTVAPGGSARITSSNSVIPCWYSKSDEQVICEYIVYPQDLEVDPTFSASIDGYEYSVDINFASANKTADGNSDNSFVSGRQYNVYVSLGRTALSLDYDTDSGDAVVSIEPWDEYSVGTYDAY